MKVGYNSMVKQRKTVKCEGRFSELRQYLYDDVFPLVMGDKTLVGEQDLRVAWDLVKDDVFGFDPKDPYYESRTDSLRKKPSLDHLSLVPLIETPSYGLEKGLIKKYALSQNNDQKVSEMLEKMNDHPLKFFREVLHREPNTVVFPGTKANLGRYLISADVGIGTLIEGGMQGGGVRSDSPFLLGVNYMDKRSERNLAAVIGFWANDNSMIVSQIQPCRNANLPKETTLGEGCLYLAEVAAREMGFDEILTYSAREHPIFKEYPSDWGKDMGKTFVCIYDNSAKKLGFNGSRTQNHSKLLSNGKKHPTITLRD